MQTVRTFRKLRGGAGGGKEGKGTVLHMKLINTRRLEAERRGLGGGKRQQAGLTFSPRTGSGELLLPQGDWRGEGHKVVAPAGGSPNHSLRPEKRSEALLPLVPGPQVCQRLGLHLPT